MLGYPERGAWRHGDISVDSKMYNAKFVILLFQNFSK